MATAKRDGHHKRSYRPREIGSVLAQVTRGPFRKRGFAQGEVLTRWPQIVGEVLARHSCPERLSFGRDPAQGATLLVRASSGFATELQHLQPIVLDRINTYFGYPAVSRLSIVQGPLPTPAPVVHRTLRELTAEEERHVGNQVAGTRDSGLAAALRALGRSIVARNDHRT